MYSLVICSIANRRFLNLRTQNLENLKRSANYILKLIKIHTNRRNVSPVQEQFSIVDFILFIINAEVFPRTSILATVAIFLLKHLSERSSEVILKFQINNVLYKVILLIIKFSQFI